MHLLTDVKITVFYPIVFACMCLHIYSVNDVKITLLRSYSQKLGHYGLGVWRQPRHSTAVGCDLRQQ